MKSILHIFHFQKEFSQSTKFSILFLCITFLHFFYAITFATAGFSILFWYNIISSFFYMISVIILKRNHFMPTILYAVLEVCSHSVLTSIFLGAGTGFPTFNIILVPILFYMAFSFGNFKQKILIPSILSLFSLSIFYISWAITEFRSPIYTNIDASLYSFLYLFNSFVNFFMLLFFSLLFLFEIKSMQLVLETKNKELDALANYDPLTRLLNRRSLDFYIEQTTRNCENGIFHFILCDIDNFKAINDNYGHLCGDHVLVHISNIIFKHLGPNDHACRWGGEEMLLFINGAHATAYHLAECIRREIEETPTIYEDLSIHHTVTFGIARCYSYDTYAEDFCRADNLLYQGKKNGKNQINSEK